LKKFKIAAISFLAKFDWAVNPIANVVPDDRANLKNRQEPCKSLGFLPKKGTALRRTPDTSVFHAGTPASRQVTVL
jgi:hypothetical protein